MKLAFCLFRYFPFGGLQRDFLRIAKECIRRGHEVSVFTMCWQGEREPNIPVHIIPTKGWQHHTRIQHFAKQLSEKIADYDLVVGFNKLPGLDVYYAADTCFQAKARQKHPFATRFIPRYRHYIALEAAVFAKSKQSEILLISKNQQSAFEQYYQTDSRRFHLLPPGISRDRMAGENQADIRQTLRKEYALKPDEKLLLMVGSGFKTKGLDRILLGLVALPDELKKQTSLFVIGQDNETLFKRQAKKLGIASQVQFLGGRDDVPRFLQAADCLVHPAYHENTGTVLLEALASGLPVLTTDVCGYAHYIETAKAGIVLSSPFEQAALNLALIKMLQSHQQAEWQQSALEFAKKADIYDMPLRAVDKIEAIYAERK